MDLKDFVLNALKRACSQDASVLKPAESQLQESETQPGFYTALLSVCCNHTIDVNVRWLSVLYFKNGLDRYWRRNAPNGILEEEKIALRRNLMSSFNEPVPQIATQLAVLIGKIARLDCPHHWHDLIPTLIENIRTPDQLQQHRTLLTLYHVVKTLSSKRLVSDRKVFQQLCANIFSYIMQLWDTHFNLLVNLLAQGGDSSVSSTHLDQSLLALKVLRKLGVYGMNDVGAVEDANVLLSLVLERIEFLLKAKQQFPQELLSKREKFITLMSKLLLDIQEYHPNAYLPYIRRSLEMTVRFNFTSEGSGLIYERFTVNAFNLMRAILRCEQYRLPLSLDVHEVKDPVIKQAYEIKMAFFTANTLQEICQRLLLDYFVLTTDDLEMWSNDPEQYIADTAGDSWKFTIRPCTENLYLTLIKEYRVTVTPTIVNLVKQFHQTTDPDDLSALLKKEAGWLLLEVANKNGWKLENIRKLLISRLLFSSMFSFEPGVYTGIGLASFDLFDDIDFKEWFTNELQYELTVSHNNYRIIRRRVIWLIGCWIHSLKCQIYDKLMPCLTPTEDLVVRIETANTLKAIVDDFEFSKEEFMPYLDLCFGMLFQLLKDVSEGETKMHILYVMSFIIERVEHAIRPHAAALLHYLPLLWEASADHNMLRCAIVTTMVHLVQSFGVLSVSMHELLFSIIRMSTDLSSDCHAYLLEDGLELWKVTVQCSPICSDLMIQLWNTMPELVEYSTEIFPCCLDISEAYLLANPQGFLQVYGHKLIEMLKSCATDMRSEGLVLIIMFLDKLIQCLPADKLVFTLPLVQWFFQNLFEDDELPTVGCVAHILLFARIILHSQPFFTTVVESLAQQTHRQPVEFLSALLDKWIGQTDCMAASEKRKLSAMAMASLLPSNSPIVLERFSLIVNVCVEALHDITQEEDNVFVDSLVISDSNPSEGEDLENYETEHQRRQFKLSLHDPVCVSNLRDFVEAQLMKCQHVYGTDAFTQLLDSMDADLHIQLKHFLK